MAPEAASLAFEALMRTGSISRAVVRVEDEAGAVVFEAAAGEARPGVALGADSRFHVASVAKTMTATLLLQLWEEGALGPRGLDAPFAAFDVFPEAIMARLHAKTGVDARDRLTLRRMLMHTAGLRDAMEDDARQLGGPAPGSVIGRMLAPGGDPTRHWEPWDPARPNDPDAGVINAYLAGGLGEAALWSPGWGFHYSDTGYMLLALLMERLTGRSYASLLRDRIFTPLKLADTYLAYRDDPVGLGPRREPEADLWSGGQALLSAGVSLSFDWGGGGVVATAADLNRFLRGLLGGLLFRDGRTLRAMMAFRAPRRLKAPRTGVGLGLFRIEVDGLTMIGHSGATGAKMFFAPDLGLFIAGTVNQTAAPAVWHAPVLAACAPPKPARSLR